MFIDNQYRLNLRNVVSILDYIIIMQIITNYFTTAVDFLFIIEKLILNSRMT